MSAAQDLRPGRVAVIGVEDRVSYVGVVSSLSDGLVVLKIVDPETGFVISDRVEVYSLTDICDYEFSYSLSDTFSDEEGNQYTCIEHMSVFAEDWNKVGFYR